MKRFFAAVVYLVVGLPLAFSALLLFAAAPWAGNRDFYRHIVDDDRLYAAIAAPEMAKAAPQTIELGAARFDGHGLVAAVQRNLPVAALKGTGESVVDAAFARVAAGEPLGGAVDLRALKAALRQRSPAIAGDYVAALPARPDAGVEGDFTWRPESVPPASERALMAQVLGAAVDRIPDQAAPPESPNRGKLLSMSDISPAALTRSAFLLSALSVLLISGLAYLGGRSAGARLKRAAVMLFIPSLVAVAGGILIMLPGGFAHLGILPASSDTFPDLRQVPALLAFIASALAPAARGLLIAGLVGASLGGLSLSFRRIAEPREIE
ncbi:MAG TPA: hypothetical protein VMC79_09185 [Rectinemataceae bacterium]|nr:hypothetical protein [Rectinemataceae bacterium]